MKRFAFRKHIGWVTSGVVLVALLPWLFDLLIFRFQQMPALFDIWEGFGMLALAAMFMASLYSIFFAVIAKDRSFFIKALVCTVLLAGAFQFGSYAFDRKESIKHSDEA